MYITLEMYLCLRTLISSGTVHDPRTHCCEYTGATMALSLHIGRHCQCRTHLHHDTVYVVSVHLTDSAQIYMHSKWLYHHTPYLDSRILCSAELVDLELELQ